MKSETDIKKANLLANAKFIREVFANMPSVYDEGGLLLLGATGSGKSTIANYLLGRVLNLKPLIEQICRFVNSFCSSLHQSFILI